MSQAPLLSVAQAAEALGLSEQRIRALAAVGGIEARKIGGRWLVEQGSVERLRNNPPEPGRPYSAESAWGYLFLLSGRDPEWLSPWSRSRLLQRMRAQHPNPAMLRRRAEPHLLYAHPGLMDRLYSDGRLVLSGASAARQRGVDIVARGELEAYVPRADLGDVVNDHKLSPAPRPNVMLRAVEGHWPFAEGERLAPDAVVALDLLESDDDRSQREGRHVLDRLIAGYA